MRGIVEIDAGDSGGRLRPDAPGVRRRVDRIDDGRIEMAARMRRADFRRRIAVDDDGRRLAAAERVEDQPEPFAKRHDRIRSRARWLRTRT